jgi:hypothetical protein
MPGILVRVLATMMACLIAFPAGAQMEGCALALGRTPQNTLAFQPVFGMPDPQSALNRASASFQQPGHFLVNASAALNGGVAAVVYTHLSGTEVQQFSADSTAYGAILNVLGGAGGLHDKRRALYVKWVRCTNSEPLTSQHFEQITWSNSLTAQYSGYKAQVQEFTSLYGSFYMMPGAGSTVPPNPTPAPPGWGADTPVGCWQRFDHLNRADGNVVSILPAIRSDGSRVFEGRYVALSPVDVSAGRQKNDVGIVLRPDPRQGSQGNYSGWYEFVSGNQRSDSFMVTGDTISGGLTAKPVEKFTWRRVNCPPR